MSSDSSLIKQQNILPFVGIAASVVGVFFVGQQLVVTAVVVLLQVFGKTTDDIQDIFSTSSYGANLVLLSLVAAFMVAFVYGVLRLIKEPDIPKRLMLRKRPTPYQLVEVFAAFGLFLIATFIMRVFLHVTGLIDVTQSQDLGLDSPETSAGRLAIFAMLVILPPIWEELLFRGYLFNKLKQYSTVGIAYVLTSFMFGLAHIEGANLNWIAVADTAIFSVFLIYISQRHQSLYSAMALHALKNGLAFLVLFGI